MPYRSGTVKGAVLGRPRRLARPCGEHPRLEHRTWTQEDVDGRDKPDHDGRAPEPRQKPSPIGRGQGEGTAGCRNTRAITAPPSAPAPPRNGLHLTPAPLLPGEGFPAPFLRPGKKPNWDAVTPVMRNSPSCHARLAQDLLARSRLEPHS